MDQFYKVVRSRQIHNSSRICGAVVLTGHLKPHQIVIQVSRDPERKPVNSVEEEEWCEHKRTLILNCQDSWFSGVRISVSF